MQQAKPNKPAGKCPVCNKAGKADFHPFCSAGCKDRDLLQWLGDGYRIPGPVALMDDEDSPSSPSENDT